MDTPKPCRVILAIDGPSHFVRHGRAKRTACGRLVPRGSMFGAIFAGAQCKVCARIVGLPMSSDGRE